MLTLTHPQTGQEYQLDRLPRCPGESVGGWRLTGATSHVCHVHQLPGGRVMCDCEGWTEGRACEHVKLLRADGLIDAPVGGSDPYDPFGNGLVDIDIDGDDWDLDEIIELADAPQGA